MLNGFSIVSSQAQDGSAYVGFGGGDFITQACVLILDRRRHEFSPGMESRLFYQIQFR
jgi:hypothetical protein